DLVITNRGSNNVSVLRGNGNGTFQSTVNFAVAANPVAAAVGDFNGDGRIDVAATNQNSNCVSVLLNNCVLLPPTPTSIPNPTATTGPAPMLDSVGQVKR